MTDRPGAAPKLNFVNPPTLFKIPGLTHVVEAGAGRTVEEWRADIEQSLADTQDALALEARRRDPAAFEVLVGGKAGVGGVYDRWRWLRALWRGEPFRPEHGTPAVLPAPGGPS